MARPRWLGERLFYASMGCGFAVTVFLGFSRRSAVQGSRPIGRAEEEDGGSRFRPLSADEQKVRLRCTLAQR
jgi:hypothetical protein